YTKCVGGRVRRGDSGGLRRLPGSEFAQAVEGGEEGIFERPQLGSEEIGRWIGRLTFFIGTSGIVELEPAGTAEFARPDGWIETMEEDGKDAISISRREAERFGLGFRVKELELFRAVAGTCVSVGVERHEQGGVADTLLDGFVEEQVALQA